MELLNHPEVHLEIRDAENDNLCQQEDVRYFIKNGFDLIIISPNEAEPLSDVVKEANEKGIPVVTFDRQVNGDNFTAHMEVDNYALGKEVAKYLSSINSKPLKVFEIRGPESASPAQLRHKGFLAGADSYANIEILASVF